MHQGWGGPLALITQLGVTMVASIVLGLLLGLWIDQRFGIGPWGTLAMILVGIIIGTFGVYRLVAKSIDNAVATTPPSERKDANEGHS